MIYGLLSKLVPHCLTNTPEYGMRCGITSQTAKELVQCPYQNVNMKKLNDKSTSEN